MNKTYKRRNVLGEKYGSLLIIDNAEDFIDKKGKRKRMVLCVCDCGNRLTVRLGKIKERKTDKCFCNVQSHGLSSSKIYHIWSSMRYRCDNELSSSYKNYGGRGISYDDRWAYFINFYNDMNSGYKEGLEIERINNNGNYCKENCKWATRKEQSLNKRTNVFIKHKGQMKTISQWSKITGINRTTIQARIKRGWKEDVLLSSVK